MRQNPPPKTQILLSIFLIILITADSRAVQRSSPLQISTPQKELKERYDKGVLYLTFNTIYNILEDIEKSDDLKDNLAKLHSRGLSSFLALCKPYKNMHLDVTIAFIEIDFLRREAGYKLVSDNDLKLKPVDWTKDEIALVAELINQVLFHKEELIKLRQAISSGTLKVEEALNQVSEIRNDPYISSQSLALLLVDVRVLLDRRTDELAALQQGNPQLYTTAKNFMANFDDAVPIEVKDLNATSAFILEQASKAGEGSRASFGNAFVRRLRASLDISSPLDSERQALDRIYSGADLGSKLQAAEEFISKFPGNTKREEVAKHLASQISELQDPVQQVQLLEKLYGLFNQPNEASLIISLLVDAYDKAGSPENAFNVGAAYAEKNPDDIAIKVKLVEIGAKLDNNKNIALVSQSLQYGETAIKLITELRSTNRKPATLDQAIWNQYNVQWLQSLYYSLASIYEGRGEIVAAGEMRSQALSLSLSPGKDHSETY